MGYPEWVREALAEEEGLHFCPIYNGYVACGGDDCKDCKDAKEFEECLRNEDHSK